MVSIVGGRYGLATDRGVVVASLRGRMKRSAQRVLVGDHVDFAGQPDGSATIEAILPRTNVLRRRTPGARRGTRLVAANVDQVVIVGAADHPTWDPHLIDRFVAVAAANGVPPVIVVNKSDLMDGAPMLAKPYVAAGYDVITTSVPAGTGLDALADILRDKVSLLTGPTGVGKSSLVNALEPGLSLRTKEVSDKTRAGRHATVSVMMYPLSHGGFVVDTPGLRDVGLWGVDPGDVAAAFPEFVSYARHCRFNDCHHTQEPDCAVVAACARGALDAGRLASYRRFVAEAQDAARPRE